MRIPKFKLNTRVITVDHLLCFWSEKGTIKAIDTHPDNRYVRYGILFDIIDNERHIYWFEEHELKELKDE